MFTTPNKSRNAPTSPSRRWLSGAPFEWSYVSTPSSEPLLGLSIGQVVDRAERRFGDREAVVSVHQAVRRTFSQVKEEVMAEGRGKGFWCLN